MLLHLSVKEMKEYLKSPHFRYPLGLILEFCMAFYISPLNAALSAGDMRAALEFYSRGCPLDDATLEIATRTGDVVLVRFALDLGARGDAATLTIARRMGAYDIRPIVALRPPVVPMWTPPPRPVGPSPLTQALIAKNEGLAREALASRTSPDSNTLHAACKWGNPEFVRGALDLGARAEDYDRTHPEDTVFQAAVESCNPDIIDLVFTRGGAAPNRAAIPTAILIDFQSARAHRLTERVLALGAAPSKASGGPDALDILRTMLEGKERAFPPFEVISIAYETLQSHTNLNWQRLLSLLAKSQDPRAAALTSNICKLRTTPSSYDLIDAICAGNLPVLEALIGAIHPRSRPIIVDEEVARAAKAMLEKDRKSATAKAIYRLVTGDSPDDCAIC